MTKGFLFKLSLWAGISAEARNAIEYSVREGKTECELWLGTADSATKKILEQLGFEIERISIDTAAHREYLTIRWNNLPE